MSNLIVAGLFHVLFLLGFNILFFSLVEDYSVSRWICWAYIILAYALAVAAINSRKATRDGHVYAYPKIMVAVNHAIVTLIVGSILIFFNFSSLTLTLFILLVFSGGSILVYLTFMTTESHTIATVRQDAQNKHHLMNWSSRVQALVDMTKDRQDRKRIEAVYDGLRSAHMTPPGDLSAIDAEIESKIDVLEAAVQHGSQIKEACDAVLFTVRRREEQIRMMK